MPPPSPCPALAGVRFLVGALAPPPVLLTGTVIKNTAGIDGREGKEPAPKPGALKRSGRSFQAALVLVYLKNKNTTKKPNQTNLNRVRAPLR